MDTKSYDEVVRNFHRDGYSWKESQKRADALVLEE